ncbi:MAG: hypothetical protein ACKOSS_06730 [Planctomycetia bacterium]
MRAGLRPLACLACALALAGCSVERHAVLPVVDASRVSLSLDPEGPWREVLAPAPTVRPAPAAGPGREQARQAPPGALAAASAASASPATASPPALRAAPARAPLAVPAARARHSTAPLAPHERFLAQPTALHAAQVSLVLPLALAAQVQLEAAEVGEPTPGRRVATGSATLRLRELTVQAERITVRTRETGTDVQVNARGDVRLVSRQGDLVLREEGLKGLLIANDALTPLR